MAFSISLKYFSAFFFLPVLLIAYSKKLKKVFLVVIPTAIMLSISFFVHYYHNISGPINDLAAGRATGLFSNIPFLVAYAVFLVSLFYRIVKTDYEVDSIYLYFYYGFISLALVFIFYHTQIYWIVLLEPLLIICCVLKKEKAKLIYLEEAFLTVFILYCSVKDDFHVFGNGPFNMLLLKDYQHLQSVSDNCGIYILCGTVHNLLGISQQLTALILFVLLICLFLLIAIIFAPKRSKYLKFFQKNDEVLATNKPTEITLLKATYVHFLIIFSCFIMEMIGRIIYIKR